ncbi:MAG: AMP-binding protein [Pseudomonadota bacterium]
MSEASLFPTMFWNAVKDPDISEKVAVDANGQSVTYGELGALVAERAQAFLAASKQNPGRIVLIQKRTIECCVDILAGICNGVPISLLSNSEAPVLSREKVININAVRIIADAETEQVARQIVEGTHAELEVRVRQSATDKPYEIPAAPASDQEALVIFTSGSTSEPKGIALSQNNIAVNTHGVTRVIPVTKEDHLLQVMPIHHTNGLMNQILLPLSIGARVTLLPYFEPQSFMDAMAKYQPTYFTAVPTMLSRLLDFDVPPEGIENLRFIRTGAAPLLPELQRKIEAHFNRQVIVSYGQTETTCTSAANPPDARKIGSVGKVLQGREIAILNPGKPDPVEPGQSGEVCFRGPCIAMGLVGEEAYDPDNWFRTGDCGYLDDDGYLFLTGRLKDIIIRGGANLSPRQIEDVILGHAGVAAVSVFGVPHADLGEVPVACIEPLGKTSITLSEINQRLAENLSPSHRVQHIYEFHHLPQNAIGKVDTRSMKETVLQLQERRDTSKLTVPSEDEALLEYIKRTRYYYATLGFGTPYEWAENADIPFTKLTKPLEECSVAIVTTAARFQPDAGPQGPGAPYNAKAKFYEVYAGDTDTIPDLKISHIAIDRDNTLADDINAYFPLTALKATAESGRIGRVAKHFYGLPTNRSKRVTITIDAQKLLEQCREDGVDAAIFVPNCPVCHQSVTLVARELEQAGIPTVVMGCAKDIVQAAGAPRFVFSDFPLGNSAGRPYDPESQKIILDAALNLLEYAQNAGESVQTPLAWIGREDWKLYYSNPDLLSPEEIAERKAKFDADKAQAKVIRDKVAE